MGASKLGSKVPPKSITDIRGYAKYIRDALNLGNKKIDMVELIEFILPVYLEDFSYSILEKIEMGDDEARTYPDSLLIEIRSDVYNDLTNGGRREQFTLAHELGHLIMHAGIDKKVRFARNKQAHKIYEDSEWQANEFAGEFLMPYEEALICSSVEEIHEKFGVSLSAAKVRYRKIH